MSKYKDLLNRFEELEKKYNTALDDKIYYKNKVEELQKQLSQLCSTLDTTKRLAEKASNMIDTNNINADLIQFLIANRFGADRTVEFAAVKTYRDGWTTMYLNGELLQPKNKNVMILANNGEAVEVEISGS